METFLRELVYMDGRSNKFWNITCSGSEHTLHYGRTGTDGQTKTKTFRSDEAAKAHFEKLVNQKLSKGYVDAKTEENEAAPEGGALTNLMFPTVRKQDDTYSNLSTFIGRRVVDFESDKKVKTDGSVIYRTRIDWDSKISIAELVERFLDSEAAPVSKGFILGSWSGDDCEVSPEPVVDLLVQRADRLPNLSALYLGDIISEENEMSWIQQTDVTPILAAYPDLELLRTRGGSSLVLKPSRHSKLRALAMETGGLSSDVVRGVLSSGFPELEHLELWLGTEEYGGTCSVQDLQPLFTGELFPKLNYLGLRNCDFVDDIAGVVVNSPLMQRLEVLDLSLGTLTDAGGNALLTIPADSSLKRLDLHHNYLSDALKKKLKALSFTVDTSNPSAMDDDDEWRFVAIGE